MSDLEHEVQRHSVLYLASSAGITLLGFLATIFYAHWVGADVLGQYFIFLSYFAILSLFTDLGVGYATTYRICEGKNQDSFFSAGLAIRMGLLCLISFALALFGDYFMGDFKNTGLFWILIFVLVISTFTSAISTSLGASNRLGLAASVSLLNNVTRICVQVLAIFLGFKVLGLIGGMVAGLLVELVIDLKFLDYHLKRFDMSQIKQIFSFSSWAFFSTACVVLFDNANILIIAYFLSASDAGIFGVCWTLSFFALFVSTALCNTLYVKVSRWNAAGDRNTISASLSRAMTYSLIFSLPMFAGGIILGRQLLYYLYGESFAVGATALVIVIAARIFQSIYQLFSNYLMATDHARMAFYGLGTGIATNIILSLALVPIFGLTGAAISSLINTLITILIGRHFLKEIIPVIIQRSPVIHIITSTLIMTIVLLIISLIPIQASAVTTGIMVIIGAVIYFLILLSLDKPIREDALKTLKIQWIPK